MVLLAGRLIYTATTTPDEVMAQLIPRLDNYIGCQEMLSVTLGITTFRSLIQGCLLLVFTDNEGVRSGLIRGGNRSPEVSTLVHYYWCQMTFDQVGAYAARVESHSNIADGPSRNRLSVLSRLGAECWQHQWPWYVNHLWDAVSTSPFERGSTTLST